nr:hypothetical protein GTC16762_05790 [Pigmentibacter ruber]
MLKNNDMGNLFKFCTGVSKLDFYPFTEINNWKNLGYWLLVLKPYIDRENSQDGILESYHFCDKSNTFEATVCLKATWQDGTPISSFEAAMGIAKGLAHRKTSCSIQVKGTEEITHFGWEKKHYSGVEIISPIKFKLTLTGLVENIKGVLEDILSFTTLRNIIWPVRLNSFTHPIYDPSYFDIISKYPIKFESGKYFLSVLGNLVELSTLKSKINYDFYFNTFDFNQYKNINDSEENYLINKKQNMHTFFAIFNSLSEQFSSIESRKKISSILRNIAKNSQEEENIILANGHFEVNEPGYSQNIKWDEDNFDFPEHLTEIKIAIPFPSAKNMVLKKFAAEAEKKFINIKWLDLSDEENADTNYDLQIVIARIQGNRQIWVQNIINSNSFIQQLEKFPRTLSALKKINLNSASTFPLKSNLLNEFEETCHAECSITPIFRYHLHTYSRKNLPIVLNISEFKEFYFSLNR